MTLPLPGVNKLKPPSDQTEVDTDFLHCTWLPVVNQGTHSRYPRVRLPNNRPFPDYKNHHNQKNSMHQIKLRIKERVLFLYFMENEVKYPSCVS